MEEMVARLAARFGITEDDESDQAVGEGDSSKIHTELFDKKGGASA